MFSARNKHSLLTEPVVFYLANKDVPSFSGHCLENWVKDRGSGVLRDKPRPALARC